jgi:hypothetical protein
LKKVDFFSNSVDKLFSVVKFMYYAVLQQTNKVHDMAH